MADTFTQCHFHLGFAVKNRDALIRKIWKNDLEMYITGIVQNHKHKLLAINSMPDHIHIFIGYNINQLIPNLIEEIKHLAIHGSKRKIFQNFVLNGRKDMVHLHILIRRLMPLSNTF